MPSTDLLTTHLNSSPALMQVCLSLINTWHASHESEKWNPDQTTTYQVLVSIQVGGVRGVEWGMAAEG